jgi:hypothetical protein
MMNVPSGSQANRLVFLSPVLTDAVHLSGTPHLDLRASFNKTTGNLGVILVDYSDSSFIVPSRSNDGIASLGTNSCWGDSAGIDSACFPDYRLPTANVTGWRVAKGILDAENRDSVSVGAPLVAGEEYEFSFPLLPNDYVFPAGHRVGVVVVSNYRGYTETTDASSPTAVVTVDTHLSKIVLPIVGGTSAARDAGLFGDVQAPTLMLPTGVVSAEATGTATAVTYVASASDNVDPSPSVACTPASGASFPLGRTTVHCTATDGSGNSTSAGFDVVVADTTAPALSLPSLGTISATSPDGATVAYAATASDLVDGAVTAVCSPASGTRFGVGTATVSCTASDSSHNTASGSFKVTVGDTAPPIIHVPGTITVNATGPAGAAVPYDVHAEDLVDVAPSLTCAPASGATFPLGTTTVHCTARDASGDESASSFRIVVADTALPTLQLPSGVHGVAAPNGQAHVNYDVTAADAVDPAPAVTCSPAAGSTFRVGRTIVDCAATDASGNVARGSFPVVVAAAAAAPQARDLASLVAKTKAAKVLGADLASVQKRIAKHDKRGACRELAAFTKDVRGRAGKSVSRATATVLLERARRLSVSLGC